MKDIFTPDVMSRLRAVPNPSADLMERLEVITASGPYPSDLEMAHRVAGLRGKKAAWQTYLDAARACGLLDGDEGKELIGRLIARDDDAFRSAIAECLACWFFAGKLGFPVRPKPPGRGRRVLEMVVELPDGEANVEVKAPYRERKNRVELGYETDLLAQRLSEANKQFPPDSRNILVFVPNLRWPLYTRRYDLLQALFGEFKITWLMDPKTCSPVTEPTNEFFRNGKFLNPIKAGRSPGYTRVSGVITLEEGWATGSDGPGRPICCRQHAVLVLHNPHARHRLPRDIWGDAPQFVEDGDYLVWSDGAPLQG